MNIDRNAPVGVFDSGIGGLTVAREIMRNLPYGKNRIFRRHSQSSLWKQIQRNGDPLFPPDHSFSAGTEGEGHCGGL